MINFFVELWQTRVEDNTLIANTYLWSSLEGLLKKKGNELKDLWEKILNYKGDGVYLSLSLSLSFLILSFFSFLMFYQPRLNIKQRFQERSHPIMRFIIPIHHAQNHWIIGLIEIFDKRIEIYDSYPSTWERSEKVDNVLRKPHWKYIPVCPRLSII